MSKLILYISRYTIYLKLSTIQDTLHIFEIEVGTNISIYMKKRSIDGLFKKKKGLLCQYWSNLYTECVKYMAVKW